MISHFEDDFTGHMTQLQIALKDGHALMRYINLRLTYLLTALQRY